MAVVPSFPGLRRFSEGRNFKQWTGNDSKALMKVFLPAIHGLIPDGMIRTISAFLEFCYLVHRSEIDESVLLLIDNAVEKFHKERVIFLEHGICDDFLLPRQHSMVHYRHLIQMFGAPNGLCSSITESKHIKAVKEPWRRSNHYNALGQMLLTNQRLDKMAAIRVDFSSRGMLVSPAQGNPRPSRTQVQRPNSDSITEIRLPASLLRATGDSQNDELEVTEGQQDLDIPREENDENLINVRDQGDAEGQTSDDDVRLPARPGRTIQNL